LMMHGKEHCSFRLYDLWNAEDCIKLVMRGKDALFL